MSGFKCHDISSQVPFILPSAMGKVNSAITFLYSRNLPKMQIVVHDMILDVIKIKFLF